MLARLKSESRVFDALWLLALMAFVLAGAPAASFHGDEAMQIYMSRDYIAAFIERDPARLMVTPPYYIDDDPWLRILNGSVNRYAIGLSWHLAGFTAADLPPRPGWDWGLDYARNVETGHRPAPDQMNAARLPSALMLALSVPVMFALGGALGGRLSALFASGLYALHPVILLNGRRAMMEGSLLLFGLLAVLAAVAISRRRQAGKDGAWGWWALLVLAGGLTLASKHSGIVYVAGALGWILAAAGLQAARERSLRRLPTTIVKLAVAGGLIAMLFLALSPALWNDPPARLRDLIEQRQGLLDIQVAADPLAPTSLLQRLEGIILQPFLTPPAHYEVAAWAEAAPMVDEIAAYMASPVSGLQFGALGVPLTLLAGLGLVALVWPRLRPPGEWQAGLLVWAAAAAASLLANPLPWQRYYLPWLPVAVLLAGVGLAAARRLAARLRAGRWPGSPLAGAADVKETVR